jgi:hypothetical protein
MTHFDQHDCTIVGGCVGLIGGGIAWYLKNVDAINSVLQTFLILLSILAIILGFLKKRKSLK